MTIDESPKPPRQRFLRFRRWFLRSLLGLLLLLIGFGIRLAIAHQKAVNRLAEATADMDAHHPGWRMEEIEAARPQVPDEENGALTVLAAAKLLPARWPSEVEFPTFDPPNKRLDLDQRKRLRSELELLTSARAEARKLAFYPRGRYSLVFKRDMLSTLLPHVMAVRPVTQLLMLDAILHMEDGDFNEAAVLCRAAINSARSLGNEPISISQLTRLACINIAGRAIERLLVQGELSEPDLVAFQSMLDEEMRHPGLSIAYCGERAMVHHSAKVLQDGEFVIGVRSGGDPAFQPPTWIERCYNLPQRDAYSLEEVEALPILNKLVEIAETPVHLRVAPLGEFRTSVQAAKGRINVVVGLLIAGLDRWESPYARRDCYLTCLTTALAAERYRCLHGDWPPSLEALAPRFLDTAPFDPSDAQPLRYLHLEGGVVIYSLYPDAKQQVFDPSKPSPPGEGVAVRLWNVEQRGQAK